MEPITYSLMNISKLCHIIILDLNIVIGEQDYKYFNFEIEDILTYIYMLMWKLFEFNSENEVIDIINELKI